MSDKPWDDLEGYLKRHEEDIAVDENYIYIAETGNNDGNRTNLKILKIWSNIY